MFQWDRKDFFLFFFFPLLFFLPFFFVPWPCACVFQTTNSVTKYLQWSSISLYPPLSVPGKMCILAASQSGLGKTIKITLLIASSQVRGSLCIFLDLQQFSWTVPLLFSPSLHSLSSFLPFPSSYNVFDTVLEAAD